MKSVNIKKENIAVRDTFDVIVCGGGVAGISAALASARQGKKVLLAEREFLLGGLATMGLITFYLPICDGLGTQVSFGIAEELLRASVAHGYEADYNAGWMENGDSELKKKSRFMVRFNAALAALEFEKLLIKENVTLLYGAMITDVAVKKNKITHIVISTKNGKEAFAAKSFIDATGDADICRLSGAKTELFKQGNILAYWCYEYFEKKINLHTLGVSDVPDTQKTKEQIESDNRRRYTGLDLYELSEMTCDMHNEIYNYYLSRGNTNSEHNLVTVATLPQVRMTRRISGKYTMDDTEIRKEFDDSVGLFSDWRKAGPVYELPFGTLYGKEIKNLICAGRNISVTDAMWDITRVIPVCAVSGEAAGIAAAMCDDFDKIDITALQSKLKSNGVKLHTSEL